MKSTSNRSRKMLSVVMIAMPVLASITVSIVAWPTIPERIAVHWGLDGKPDGYGSAIGTGAFLAATQSMFVIAAVGSAFARDARKARIGCAVTTAFVGLLGAVWTIIATSPSRHLAPFHDPWLVLPIGIVWGVVPFLTMPDPAVGADGHGGDRGRERGSSTRS